MGAIVPQVVSEDRASGAQIIDGGLRFITGKSQYLKTTPGSSGNRTTWTFSAWIKLSGVLDEHIWSCGTTSADRSGFEISVSGGIPRFSFYNIASSSVNMILTTSLVPRDYSSFYHVVIAVDTTIASPSSDRLKMYINGSRVTDFSSATYPNQNTSTFLNHNVIHSIGIRAYNLTDNPFDGQISNFYIIDGQALDASYFGFTDPLTNTWRPKLYKNTTALPGDGAGRVGFGTNGFYLPLDGNSPIGVDKSSPVGTAVTWTPVNFGGSNTLEKATGALPILNTDGGGKVARVGVRTDNNPVGVNTYCTLALPLVGIKSDFCNQVSGGTNTNKVVTATGAAGITTISNFYGGSYSFSGSSQYITVTDDTSTRLGTGDFTVEYWIYYNSVSGNPTPLDKGYTGSGLSANGWVVQNAAAVWYGGGSAKATSPYTDVIGKWYHYAFVRKSGTLTIYRDGASVASGSDSTDYSYAVDIGVGANIRAGAGFAQYVGAINGYMSDLRIYKGLAKYTSNFIPASTDPDIVPDSPSGVSYSSNLVPVTDGAVYFDGSGDYLSLGSSTDFAFGTGDFTIEWFQYWNSTSSIGSLYDNGYTSNPGCLIQSNSGGTYNIWVAGSSFTSSRAPGTGKWIHYAAVRSGTTVTFYQDGVADGSATLSGNAGTSASGPFIGGSTSGGGYYINGFISNFHVVKGTALYTANFTPPTAPISSVANTKLLCCKSNSSATTADVTPGTITANGNVAASNFNPFTVNIKTVRGLQSGYATLNPLNMGGITLTNGNLNWARSAGGATNVVYSNVAVSSGKWYFESTMIGAGSGVNWECGVAAVGTANNIRPGTLSTGWGFVTSGTTTIYKQNNNTLTSIYTGTLSTNDIVGVALDLDNGRIWFSLNNIWLEGNPYSGTGASYTNLSGTIIPFFGGDGSAVNGAANFGQKPFKFPPPAGFQPLTLANTPRPTIVRPDQYVGVTTYTGNGGTQSINVGFQPDFVWIKQRQNVSRNHVLFDTVRGATKALLSSTTDSEQTYSTTLTSFDRNGFTLGSDDKANGASPLTYVAWAWKAGGNSNTYNIDGVGYATTTAAGLTAGTITPTGASVNTKSGFSIVSFTSDSSTNIFSVPHGLSNTPKFVIVKSRDNGVAPWYVYHSSLATDNYLRLNGTNATASDGANQWGNGMTSSVIGLRAGYTTVASTNTIAYCWAEIPGFSKFGSYASNNSTDGPFVWLGMRPRWIMIKNISVTDDWIIYDSTRGAYNLNQTYLFPNTAGVEGSLSTIGLDILSNGFKLRSNDSHLNSSTNTYIYAAFAETPNINLYGAQANAR